MPLPVVLATPACSDPVNIESTLSLTVFHVEHVLFNIWRYLERLEALPFAVYNADPTGCPLPVQNELTLSFRKAACFSEPVAVYCETAAKDLSRLLAATGNVEAITACLTRMRERLPFYSRLFQLEDLHNFKGPGSRSNHPSVDNSPSMDYIFRQSRHSWSGRVRQRRGEARVSYGLCFSCLQVNCAGAHAS